MADREREWKSRKKIKHGAMVTQSSDLNHPLLDQVDVVEVCYFPGS